MGQMKLSIIIPVLDSHRIVRRQIRHFKQMNLPNDIEILLMDDGSKPSLRETFPNYKSVMNLNIYPTYDKRPWSNACAKNMGAKIAEGEYLFMTDIDHILPKEAIDAAYNFTGDKMVFDREYAILNNKGQIIQSIDALRKYGFRRNRFKTYNHTNTFCMKHKIFWDIGGYPEEDCDWGRQDHRDDTHLYNRYRRHVKAGKCKPAVQGPVTYVFPNVAEDQQKLFHKLNRYIGFSVKTTSESIKYLSKVLDKNERVVYTRFGDSEVFVMDGKRGYKHNFSKELQNELIEAFTIQHKGYIKAASLGYPKERGMTRKAFLFSDSRVENLRNIAAKLSKERVFYNPIVFHYLSLFHPKTLIKFINKYIKPKKKMFIGGNDKKAMESLYGKIDYYIKTPREQAYYSINEWWPQVLKNIWKCEVVLPSCGHASNVICKRIWKIGANLHCLDIGSINDVLEGNVTRGWVEKMGVKTIKRNLIGNAV